MGRLRFLHIHWLVMAFCKKRYQSPGVLWPHTRPLLAGMPCCQASRPPLLGGRKGAAESPFHCLAMPKAVPGFKLFFCLAFWSAVAVTGALSCAMGGTGYTEDCNRLGTGSAPTGCQLRGRRPKCPRAGAAVAGIIAQDPCSSVHW